MFTVLITSFFTAVTKRATSPLSCVFIFKMENYKELNRNEKLAIGTDTVVVSIEKQKTIRRSIILTNTSTGGQVLTLAIDEEATANEGIVLSVGGTWSDNAEGGYQPTQKIIQMVSNLAGAQVSIQERLWSPK